MTEYICPDCHCRFLSAFRCVTCGAQKLYDHTLALAMTEAARLRAEVERLTGEVSHLRWRLDALHRREACGHERRLLEALGKVPENLTCARCEVERLTAEVAALRAAGLAMEANRDRCVAILEGLISAAWDAGAAHAIGSHKDFVQTHPSKAEWLEANGVGRSDE